MEYERMFCATCRKYTLWEGKLPKFKFYCMSCGDSPMKYEVEKYISDHVCLWDKVFDLIKGDEHVS